MSDWGEEKCIDNDLCYVEAGCQQKPFENTQFHYQIVLGRHDSERRTDETLWSGSSNGTVLKKYTAEVSEEVERHSLGYVPRHFTTETAVQALEKSKSVLLSGPKVDGEDRNIESG